MSLIGVFSEAHGRPKPLCAATPKRRREAPFAIRLNRCERARLTAEAAGMPLGTYIKAKALGGPPVRMRRTGHSIEDRQALARALALLGGSRLASNVNQLAKLANTGSLPLTPEVIEELRSALHDIHSIRVMLLAALGLKPEGGAR